METTYMYGSTLDEFEDIGHTFAPTTKKPFIGPRSVTSYWEYHFYHAVFTYCPMVILVFGTVSNILAIIVLQSRHMRASGTNFLLTALALADLGVMYTSLLRFFIQFTTGGEVDIRGFNINACRFHLYFTYLFVQLSPLTLTLITIERVISVCFPLQAKSLCRKSNTIKAWVALAFILAAVNSITLFTVSFKHRVLSAGHACGYNNEVFEGWYLTHLFVSSYLPCFVIFFGNGIIIFQLIAADRKRKTAMQSTETNSKSAVTSRMLVIVSMAFLVLTVPTGIYINGQKYWDLSSSDPETKAKSLMAYAITQHLFSLNNAINFLLYCVFSRNFRHVVADVLCCRNLKGGATISSTRKSGLGLSRHKQSTNTIRTY